MSDAKGMSFKARMNNIARSFGLRPQTIIQNFMFERFLVRLSKSEYRENFVIKGGVLISSLIGLKSRSTMDMDATAIGLPISVRSIRHAIGKIATINAGDDVTFKVNGAAQIRVDIEGYGGIRIKLTASYHGLCVPLSVDITKGDAITPKPVAYKFYSSFSDGEKMPLLAYTVETVLAEKCESILKRNIVGTRPRDYYDIYMLTKLKKIRPRIFSTALYSTFETCGTLPLLDRVDEILNLIASSSAQEQYWHRYQVEFPFAKDISFVDTLVAVRTLLAFRKKRDCVRS